MTVIRVECDDHAGQFELTPEDVKVIVDADGRLNNWYRFICPVDQRVVFKKSEPRITDLLIVGTGCEKLEYHSDVSSHLEEHRQIEASNVPHVDDVEIDFGELSVEGLSEVIENELSVAYESFILLFRQQHGLS